MFRPTSIQLLVASILLGGLASCATDDGTYLDDLQAMAGEEGTTEGLPDEPTSGTDETGESLDGTTEAPSDDQTDVPTTGDNGSDGNGPSETDGLTTVPADSGTAGQDTGETTDLVEPSTEPNSNGESIDESTPPDGPVEEVTINDFQAQPATLTVTPGTTVRWTNASQLVDHTVTSGTPGDETGLFDFELSTDETAEHTFDELGDYPFFCRFYPESVIGEIRVEN